MMKDGLVFEIKRDHRHLDPELYKKGDVLYFLDGPEYVFSTGTAGLITIMDQREVNDTVVTRSYVCYKGAINFGDILHERFVDKKSKDFSKYTAFIERRKEKHGRI